MTLKEAREDLVAQARLDLDLYKGFTLDAEGNEVAEAEGATDLISRACIWWAKMTYCMYEPAVALTLTVPATPRDSIFDLRDTTVVATKVWKPRTVTVNDTTLRRFDGKQKGLWTMPQLQMVYPTWWTAGNAQPTAAVWLPTGKLLLFAPPDAIYSGKNFIDGWTLPNTLTVADDDEELPIPFEEDHWTIVRLALAFGSMPNVSEGDAWNRLAAMGNWWKLEAKNRKSENVNAILGRKPRGDNPDWMYAG